MAAERREGTKGNNENDSDEGNNLQRQQRDVKLIAHELQRGVCEREIKRPLENSYHPEISLRKPLRRPRVNF